MEREEVYRKGEGGESLSTSMSYCSRSPDKAHGTDIYIIAANSGIEFVSPKVLPISVSRLHQNP